MSRLFRLRLACAAGALALTLALPRVARADDEPPPPTVQTWVSAEPPPGAKKTMLNDPVSLMGIGTLVTGGVLVAMGIPLWVASVSSEEKCGRLAGCFESYVPNEAARDSGTALTGLGLGFAATGALTLLATSRGIADRENPKLAATGIFFAGLTFGSLVGIVTVGATLDDANVDDPYLSTWPLVATASISATLAVPFLVAGAPFASDATRMRRQRERARHGVLVDPMPTRIVAGPTSASVTWSF